MIEKQTDESIYYHCPNGCGEDNDNMMFYQGGTMEASELLTETGEVIETEDWEFTPTEPVKCRHCYTEAIIGKKRVAIITEIE